MVGKSIFFVLGVWIAGAMLPSVFADEYCEQLADLSLQDTVITEAQAITPPWLSSEISSLEGKPHWLSSGTITASQNFCRVKAVIKPTTKSNIRIEIWLPLSKHWNGKYLGTGNGGAGGAMIYEMLALGIDKGYATSHTDMGTSNKNGASSTFGFGIGEPEKVVDWAYRSTHLMTQISKRIIQTYYAREAERSYFIGCSTGGHQALAEAQKYPQDYDGIIAAAPGHNRTNLHMSFIWAFKALHDKNIPYISVAQIPILKNAVLTACDSIDGLVDGVIDDPRQCDFNPAILLCQNDTKGKNCFSKSQVSALEKIYGGARNPRTGDQVYYGLTPGAEAGLSYYLEEPRLFFPEIIGWSPQLRWGQPDTEWGHSISFDFDKDTTRVNTELAEIINSTNPDLSEFNTQGGKIILYTGAADPIIPLQDVIDYYENVVEISGSREKTMAFARLFVAPGMAHCSGGYGPNKFDMIDALEQWAEYGVAPRRIIATKYNNDDEHAQGVSKTRPLCAYPQVARWRGIGSSDEADNFACIDLRNSQEQF